MASATSEDKKLKAKILSIHTYSKAQQEEHRHLEEPQGSNAKKPRKDILGSGSKRSKKEFHSYAKTWQEEPGCKEASLPPDGLDAEQLCKRPLRRSTELRSLPRVQGHVWKAAEKACLLEFVEQHSDSGVGTAAFWRKCAKHLNDTFKTRRTALKCKELHLQLVDEQESSNVDVVSIGTPQEVVEEQPSPLETMHRLNSAPGETWLHGMVSNAPLPSPPAHRLPSPPPRHLPSPPSHHLPSPPPRLQGLEAANPACPPSHNEPSPNISIEESHQLMQAVLTLSSAHIASVTMRVPNLRAAVMRQLAEEEVNRPLDLRTLPDQHPS